MAISDDIGFYYSGSGTAVTSLGGAIHANTVSNSTTQNLFQNIASPLSSSKQYYCIYLKNTGTTSYNVGLYISTPTPNTKTELFIGVGTSSVNGTEQTIADSSTEPTGILWVQRKQEYNALSIATLGAGNTQAVWVQLNQSANASGGGDYAILTLKAL